MTVKETTALQTRTVFALLIGECQRVEAEHGFGNQSLGEDIALMHSELSEALEDIRAGRAPEWLGYEVKDTGMAKPIGVPSELADVVIRIFAFCGRHGVDLAEAVIEKMAYNESRPFKHGGKVL